MKDAKHGLITDSQLAEHINVSRSFIWALVRKDPSFPRPIKISRGTTRWRWSDIAAWEANLTSTK